MKSIKQLLKQKPIFLNDFTKSEDVYSNFEEENYNPDTGKYERSNSIEKVNILFASYGCANYSGEAFVLFEQDGKLFEVNGSHCSCFGLEGQWEPEETTLESLKLRLIEGKMGQDDYSDNVYSEALIKFLGIK